MRSRARGGDTYVGHGKVGAQVPMPSMLDLGEPAGEGGARDAAFSRLRWISRRQGVAGPNIIPNAHQLLHHSPLILDLRLGLFCCPYPASHLSQHGRAHLYLCQTHLLIPLSRHQ